MSLCLLLLYPEIMKNKNRSTNVIRQKQIFNQIWLRILMDSSFPNKYLSHFSISLFFQNCFKSRLTAVYYWILPF